VAAITVPVPDSVPTTQPAHIGGTLQVAGFNVKKLKERQEEIEQKRRAAALRMLQIEVARRLAKRQSGCTFFITVDNVTVYSVDLDTLSQGQTIAFNTSDFTPNDNSTIAYVEQCPPGTTTFPQLNVANLTLVTGPAAPSAVSSVSSGYVLSKSHY
jgi:hypothetical protein